MFIGRSLYAYGEWGGEEASVIAHLAVSGGGLALDVGANIGFMSMAMLAVGCRVVAFEPQPALFDLLVDNCTREGWDFTSFPIALSDFIGKSTMPRIRYGEKGNYGALALGQRSELGTITVDCAILNNIVLTERIGFIKIDVEGHEVAVLRGGRERIMRDRPIMYIEDDRPEKSLHLQEMIKGMDYRIERHYPRLFRENNFAGNQVNIWDQDYSSHNLICRPC
jgi:FkbM family methyltransferase